MLVICFLLPEEAFEAMSGVFAACLFFESSLFEAFHAPCQQTPFLLPHTCSCLRIYRPLFLYVASCVVLFSFPPSLFLLLITRSTTADGLSLRCPVHLFTYICIDIYICVYIHNVLGSRRSLDLQGGVPQCDGLARQHPFLVWQMLFCQKINLNRSTWVWRGKAKATKLEICQGLSRSLEALKHKCL